MKSILLKLKKNDFVKGLIITMIAVIVTSLYQFINSGSIPTDWNSWKTVLLASLGAGLSYIIKNWLTNSQGEFLKKEQ